MRGFRIGETREVEKFAFNDAGTREASKKATVMTAEEKKKLEEAKNFWDSLINDNIAN